MVTIIDPEGRVTVIAHARRDKRLWSALGAPAHICRVARIEPAHPLLRLAFALCHRLPAVGGWARRWRCRWRARLMNGELLGVFPSRAEAVRAEEEFAAETHVEKRAAVKLSSSGR